MPSPTTPTNKPGGPGQQQGRRRRPRTRYAMQLQEKQDLKKIFGVREEQLRKYYNQAHRQKGETGSALISILESRLDNTIFRAGFAETRPQARQMASHRLFAVNGRAVTIPSYALRPGDVVTVRKPKQNKSYFQNFAKRSENLQPPSWIEMSPKEYSIKIVASPTTEEANVGIDIRAVVEYFAR